MFSKVKINFLMFSDSNIAYLSNSCLRWFINIREEGAILPITVRRIDTWKLGLENILGYHPWHLEKLSHQKRPSRDHLLNCNNIPSFGDFTILAFGHHKYIFEIKESLLIKCDRPVLNKNISSTKLFIFYNN